MDMAGVVFFRDTFLDGPVLVAWVIAFLVQNHSLNPLNLSNSTSFNPNLLTLHPATSQPLTSRTFLWLLDPTGLRGSFFKTSAYPPLYHLFSHKPIDTLLVSSIQSVWPGNQDCVQVILEVLFVTELVSVKSKILGGEHFEALPDGVFVVAGFTLFPWFLSHT